jgi:Glycosyl hydrolases family 18
MKGRLLVVGLCLALALVFIAAPHAEAQACNPAWVTNHFYSVGNLVSYSSRNYRCQQAHTSLVGWEPPNAPALWVDTGACSGSATPTAAPRATPTTAPGSTPTPTAAPSGGTCAPAWNSATAYASPGTLVSRVCPSSTQNYANAFWTQNNDPCTMSGPAGSGQPWIPKGACSGSGGGGATPTPVGATATPTVAPCTNCTSSIRSAPYADISLGVGSQIAANAASAGLPGVTLAFLVDGGCTATWGGGLGPVSNANFPNGTTVKSAIDALTGAGRKVVISWGGANGSIASSCTTASQIQAMYQSVFNAYPNISGQDFDIEGGINTTAVAQALAGLKAANSSKSISLTLPVLSSGLVSAGLAIVNACHAAGFHPDTVNVMAMDMGSANDNGGNMLLSSQQAAQNTRAQTGDPIGITPMIGVNDTSTEIFTIANATALVSWAKGQSYVNRLAFWSLARDNGGCAGQGFASATCSGVAQNTWQFSNIFAGY